MRYFVLTVLVLMLIAGVAQAAELETKNLNLPNVQGGMVYSIQNDKVEAATTATLLAYPTKIGKFELRGGYVIEATPIAAICYQVGDLTKFGFEQPLLNLLDLSIGGYVGYDFATASENEWDYGVLATVVNLKF